MLYTVVSLINRIQRQLCFDVPTPLIIYIKHNGDDASKELKTSWFLRKSYAPCSTLFKNLKSSMTAMLLFLIYDYYRNYRTRVSRILNYFLNRADGVHSRALDPHLIVVNFYAL